MGTEGTTDPTETKTDNTKIEVKQDSSRTERSGTANGVIATAIAAGMLMVAGAGLAGLGCLGPVLLPHIGSQTDAPPPVTQQIADALPAAPDAVVIAPMPGNAVMCDGNAAIRRLINDDGTVAGVQFTFKAADDDWEFVRVTGVLAAHDLDETGHAGQNYCVTSDGKAVTTAALNAGVYNQSLAKTAKPEERLTVPEGEGEPAVFCERFKRTDCELSREAAAVSGASAPTTAAPATATAPVVDDATVNPPTGVIMQALKGLQDSLNALTARVDKLENPNKT